MLVIKFPTLVLLLTMFLYAQNYLPEDRKGDWQHAGCLRFIRDDLSIDKINNILDYGGNNTGATGNNNHLAIANAIADKSTDGLTLIYFPAGTYIIESTIPISGVQNIIIGGDGSAQTRLIFSISVDEPVSFNITNSNRIGFENFYIERQDSAFFGRNFSIHSDSCWISGVESYRAGSEHVYVNSSNVEIRGCYFHHSWTYGSSGNGYGIVLRDGAAYCLVEDNIFNHFRHSVILANGPHDNVVGYNYSRDPYTTETYLGISDWPSDMCLHGHPDADSSGPYKNLFEGNICAFMHADDAFDENGPYNTYFRCRATYYGIKIYSLSNNQNVIANEVDDSDGSLLDFLWNAFDIESSGNYVMGNINFDPSTPDYPGDGEYSADLSLYLNPSDLPGFLNTAGYFPPIGAVDASHLGGGTIPAKDRWDGGGVLTIMEEHLFTNIEAGAKFEETMIQCRPNPFNANIRISIQKRENRHQKAEVKIYNLSGRVVADLTSEINNGFVNWNASNQSSGVFIVRLIAGKQIVSKRISLIK